MEIRVYNSDLTFLGVVENFKSLLWYRKYYETGRFELHAPATEKNLELLKAGNIITKRGSVEAGVIGEYDDQEGASSNQITRKGDFLSTYTSRRILHYTHNFTGTYEDGMRYLVGAVEKIPQLTLGDKCGATGTVTFQVTWKNLQTMLTKLSKSSGLGYRVRPDFRKKVLYFEVYEGVDHSTQQNTNPRVIFSRLYGNLNDVHYTCTDKKYGTVFYVGGEGEESERKIVTITIGEADGVEMREVFIDAKDIKKDELTNEEYEAALLERGYEKATEYCKTESVEAEVQNTNFIYKEHWDLGDIVTVQKKEWGITLHKRVTEVQEIYENGGSSIVPTFGEALPDTIDLSEG